MDWDVVEGRKHLNFSRWEELSADQYRMQKPLKDLPAPIANAHIAFETDVARVMRAMADDVAGKPSQARMDVLMSAKKFQEDIRAWHGALGTQLSAEVSDMFRLSDSLASILSPLYEEVHSTFTNLEVGVDYGPGDEAAQGPVTHSP